MRSKLCTVFGGGGFIGSAVSDRLLADGHSVRIFEHPRVVPYRTFSTSESVAWQAGDFLSASDVAAAVAGSDVVLHLISTTLPKSSNDDPVYDVQSNLVGSLHILEAMRSQRIPRIVFISSGGTVYGRPLGLPIREDHATEPNVSYGIVKLAVEKYLLMYRRTHGLRPTILRVANPYGERQRVETAQGAVNAFLRSALVGRMVEIWGDGEVVRDFLHVEDVAAAFAAAVDYAGEVPVMNVGSGEGTSLNQLLAQIERTLGQPCERRYLPGRAIDVPANVLDIALAKRELGWVPKVSLEAGLRRTADWLQSSASL